MLFIVALVINEIILSLIIGFPKYGVEKKVMGIRKSEGGIQNVYKPYSEFWNVEGGNKVFKRNNLGLPGADVKINDSSKLIYVLGDSYVEASQYSPDSIATSIFKNNLDSIYANNKLCVINLGCSGHDPYDLFFRSKYFESIYKPDYVLLVLNRDFSDWLVRHKKPFNFTIDDNSFQSVNSNIMQIIMFCRNNSALFNLFVESNKKDVDKTIADVSESNTKKVENNFNNKDYSDLFEVLGRFNESYNNFLVISIVTDEGFNLELEKFASGKNIKLTCENLIKPDYLIKGKGHLNIEGNRELGNLLTSAYVKNFQ